MTVVRLLLATLFVGVFWKYVFAFSVIYCHLKLRYICSVLLLSRASFNAQRSHNEA